MNGRGTNTNFPADAATSACDTGNACACSKLAGYMGHVKAQRPAAVERFQRACDLGLVHVCSNLGVIVFYGIDVPVDKARGFALWNKACDAGDRWGCKKLADLYRQGDFVAVDPTKASELDKRAADLKRAR